MKNKLDKAREIINEVDKEMADLFIKRMRAAEMVAEYKKEKNVPVFDGARERALLDKIENLAGEEYGVWLTSFIVISSGHEYGHPAEETLERCASLAGLEPDYLLRTDEFGNIVMSSIDGKVCYSLEKENNKAYLLISYYELGTIVVLFIIFVIFSIKPIRKKQG